MATGMSGASAFFILIPVMYALFTLALAGMALLDRNLIAARWAALGFAIAFVSILVDGFRDPGGDRWISWFTVATHFLPLLVMVQAFLVRHGHRAPRLAVVLTLFGCVYVMPDMPWAPPHWLRGVFVQAVCTMIIASALPTLWSLRRTSPVDRIAVGVIALAALSYAGRTVVIYFNPIGETAESVRDFYEGLNIIFHSASALMGMSVGIVLMMTIGYDMLRARMDEGERDPLTGLGNRRRLERQIADFEAGKRTVGAVVAIDLDHFKRINDRHGHDAGDRVLAEVGRLLRALCDPMGGACRTGGEEFVMLVADEHAAAVDRLALAIRDAIGRLELKASQQTLRVTASIGFHHRAAHETVREAVERADQAVYCAKTDGRDRVVQIVDNGGLQVFRAVA